MSTVSRNSWTRYIVKLRNLSEKAADDLLAYIKNGHDPYTDPSKNTEVINYAYALATKYGEGAGALAAEMYDALAELSGKAVPPAVPAKTATYGEVAKAVYGTQLQSNDPNVMAGAIGRTVKMAGVDTMQQNALRDGAEWAWIPVGDTCAFCLTLASRGWQRASRKAIKNGHAEHIHANCDCTYVIRFSDDVDVEGYDPNAYKALYDNAEGDTPDQKINYMRRQFYAENKGVVGDDSSIAEELIIKPSKTRQILEGSNVSYNPPQKLSEPLSDNEIIQKISGGDKTEGSCQSVALAYVGNKSGYDVLDFRGGNSQKVFAKAGPLRDYLKSIGAKTAKSGNDFKNVIELIKDIQEGKEYFLGAGKHAAIIRKVGKSYEYLELQSNSQNGWKRLTNDVLKNRFGCKKSHSIAGTKVDVEADLVDITLFKNDKEFEKLLGYLNTTEASQMKGVGGYAK